MRTYKATWRTCLHLAMLLVLTLAGTAWASKVGEAAPDIAVLGTDGQQHTLREQIGKAWVVVAWYPMANTGG